MFSSQLSGKQTRTTHTETNKTPVICSACPFLGEALPTTVGFTLAGTECGVGCEGCSVAHDVVSPPPYMRCEQPPE